MSETQQPGPDEQAAEPEQAPEPEEKQAPEDEGAGSTGEDEPQVGRRPDFVGEEGAEDQ